MEEEKQMEEMKKEEEGESRRRGTRYSQTHTVHFACKQSYGPKANRSEEKES